MFFELSCFRMDIPKFQSDAFNERVVIRGVGLVDFHHF